MHTHTASSPQLLTPDQVADQIGYRVSTLTRLRISGDGPPFVKLGHRKVYYRQADVDAWIESRVRRSTSDPGAA